MRFCPMCCALEQTRYSDREGLSDQRWIKPMQTKDKSKVSAAKAVELLEQAWAYYTPEPLTQPAQEQPDLFQYANAA